MQNITSVASLKNEILLLEADQAFKGQQLKEQFFLTYESFKPGNFFKGSLGDIVSSPYLVENILGSAIGMATGFISKKLIVGKSGNIAKKVLGTALQFVITNVFTQRPDLINSFGHFIIQKISRKKEVREKLEDKSQNTEVG
jgi:hypothetical protein